jgi:S1-C subfamily serine protease
MYDTHEHGCAGFAIPIDMVKGLVEQILQFGQVVRPVLGITMGPPQLMARLQVEGVLVYSAPEGSPAAEAGVQGCTRTQYGDLTLGDIIVGINGQKVKNYADLFEVLDGCKPGDRVSLQLFRPGARQRLDVQVTLGSRSTTQQDG